ncbi:MAG: 3-oxoacid CoA-transferase subunit A [Alphaproteobacteria bacterium]
MIDKQIATIEAAVADIRDGATVMLSGFGEAGHPTDLIHALLDQGARELTIIANNAGNGYVGVAALINAGRVRRIVCSFPKSSQSVVFNEFYARGAIELELVPQGTLAERIRAAGAGVPAFYTPTSAGTPLADGKEVRDFGGRPHVLEHALRADVALVKAETADRWGNLTYRKAARNFGPIMCMAADLSIVQVRRHVGLGDIDPEIVVTPGIFVGRTVTVAEPADEQALIASGYRREPT